MLTVAFDQQADTCLISTTFGAMMLEINAVTYGWATLTVKPSPPTQSNKSTVRNTYIPVWRQTQCSFEQRKKSKVFTRIE